MMEISLRRGLDRALCTFPGSEKKKNISFQWNPLYVLVWQRDLLCAPQTEEVVIFPATEEAQKAFDDLTTVGLLQQELQ